jgi:spermidine synthase
VAERQSGAQRHAVHSEVGSGLAELVPDSSRTGRWLLFLDGVPQSQVDLDDPGYLEFEYVRRIGHVADLAFPAAEPLRALHLGGGAMTLPRYIAHTRPGSAQLVAELDAELTELVRRHLPMPGRAGQRLAPRAGQQAGRQAGRQGRIRVRAGDARQVLESVPAASYDLVISDVFAGALTPFHVTTAEYAAAAARALRPGGVYVCNVADGPPLARVRSAVATLRSVYEETCMIAEAGVLRGRRLGNLVLAGSERPLPCGELRRAAAADPFPARVLDGAELARFASGAPVITDATGPSYAAPQPTNW